MTTHCLLLFSRPRDQFFQSLQIQRSRHEFGSDDKARCPGDAEITREATVLLDDGLPFGIGHVGFQPLSIQAHLLSNRQNRFFGHVTIGRELRFVEGLMRDELAAVTQRALAVLSREHQEILRLVFYEELPYEEISVLLRIPINTVKTRVFYAKQRLKEQLERMGQRESIR